VIQTCCSEIPEVVIVETMLAHSSGEWVRGKVAMKPVKNDPQGVGSCITYARRYSLAAIVGVAPEDDDGNQASGKDTKSEKSKVTTPKEVKQDDDVPDHAPPTSQAPKVTAQQKVDIRAKMVAAGITDRAEQTALYKYALPEDDTERAAGFISQFDAVLEVYRKAVA
jgi:hypothetical protein